MALTNKEMGKKFSTTLPCVDARVTTNNEVVQQGKRYKGTFTYQDDDHVRFTEETPEPHVEHRELQWRLIDRTKHGRIHVNANHVKVEFYIRHGDYVSERQLADMLASEIETMGEALSDINLEEEVAKCC